VITKTKTRYCLRRTLDVSDASRFGWAPVKGFKFNCPGWIDFPLFTYRDDLVVFVVHEPTGLTIAVGPDRETACGAARAFLADQDRGTFFNHLMTQFKSLNIEPNPGPTYDTRRASKVPRTKKAVRRRRNGERGAIQSVLPVLRDSLQGEQPVPVVPPVSVLGTTGRGDTRGLVVGDAPVPDDARHGPAH